MTEKDRLQRQQHVALSGLFVNTSSCHGFTASWHLTPTVQSTAVKGNRGHQIFLAQWITPSIQPTAVSGNTGYQIISTIRSTVVKGNTCYQNTSTIWSIRSHPLSKQSGETQVIKSQVKSNALSTLQAIFCQKRTGRKSSWINWQCRH